VLLFSLPFFFLSTTLSGFIPSARIRAQVQIQGGLRPGLARLSPLSFSLPRFLSPECSQLCYAEDGREPLDILQCFPSPLLPPLFRFSSTIYAAFKDPEGLRGIRPLFFAAEVSETN